MLRISELIVIISSKTIARGKFALPDSLAGVPPQGPCLAGADRADAPKWKRAERVSDSLLAPQPIEKAGFGLANCGPSTGQETGRKSLCKFDRAAQQAAWIGALADMDLEPAMLKHRLKIRTYERQILDRKPPGYLRPLSCGEDGLPHALELQQGPGDARHRVACEQKQGRLTSEGAVIVNRKRHFDRVARLNAGRLAAKIA
jgi:hypothetical protein